MFEVFLFRRNPEVDDCDEIILGFASLQNIVFNWPKVPHGTTCIGILVFRKLHVTAGLVYDLDSAKTIGDIAMELSLWIIGLDVCN